MPAEKSSEKMASQPGLIAVLAVLCLSMIMALTAMLLILW
jgi:hypothetical protein